MAFVLFGWLLTVSAPSASAIEAAVNPKALNPGDAFLIKVTGAGTLTPGDALFLNQKVPFSSCGDGCFLAVGAVGLQTRSGKHAISIPIGKQSVRLRVLVGKARFATIQLTLPEEKVTLAPDDLTRADEEEAMLKAIWLRQGQRRWEGRFALPLRNEISTGFGVRRVINRKKVSVHGGLDIRGREGEEVLAANKGDVVLTRELFFGGNTVVLDHGSGIYSVYMHLLRPLVREGEPVETGQVVGLVGSSGRSTGPHLHFGIKVLGVNVDPLSVVRLDPR